MAQPTLPQSTFSELQRTAQGVLEAQFGDGKLVAVARETHHSDQPWFGGRPQRKGGIEMGILKTIVISFKL